MPCVAGSPPGPALLSAPPTFGLPAPTVSAPARLLRPRDDLVLQRAREIAEVVAVARHADDEVAVFLRPLLGGTQGFRVDDVELDVVAVEAEVVNGGNKWMTPDGVRVRFDFLQRGTKKPCSFYWHNGDPQFKPKKPENWTMSKDLPNKGTIYIGEKKTGFTDQRSNNPRLVNMDEMKAFNKAGFPAEKYPRVKGGPVVEWVKSVKDGSQPGSNFDYAAPMTEVMLLGILAVNHGGKIEWDSKNMKITNRPELNQYLKEPVSKGWEYGQNLWA